MSLVFSVDGAKSVRVRRRKRVDGGAEILNYHRRPDSASFGLSVVKGGGGAVNIRGKSFQNKCLCSPLLVQCGRQ